MLLKLPPVIKRLFVVLSELPTQDVQFTHEENQIVIQSLDTTRCVFLSAELPIRNDDEEFEPFMIDVDTLKRPMKRISLEKGRKDKITLTLNKKDKKLTLFLDGKFANRVFTMNTFPPSDSKTFEPPQISNMIKNLEKIEYTAELVIDCELLQSFIKDIDIYDTDHVDFIVQEDGAIFVQTEGTMGRIVVYMKPIGIKSFEFSSTIKKLSFSVSPLRQILSMRLAKDIRIRIAERYPMLLEFTLIDYGKVKIWLAPHLDEEEEEEDEKDEENGYKAKINYGKMKSVNPAKEAFRKAWNDGMVKE